MKNFEENILNLSYEEIKTIYLRILKILDPNLEKIILEDEMEEKEEEDKLIILNFFKQLNLDNKISDSKTKAEYELLIKLAHNYPNIKNEIKLVLNEDNVNDVNLGLSLDISSLTPIIFAVSVAIIRPYIKFSKTKSKVNFEIELKGIDNIEGVIQSIFDYIKNNKIF